MPGNLDGWEEIKARVAQAENAHVRVGVLAEHGGSATHEGTDITIVELAAIHEFGSPSANIPERSFIRYTLEHDRAKIESDIARLSALFVQGKITVERALGILGEKIVGYIRDNITERRIKQDLAPSTIARKNRTALEPGDATTALIDTGQLIGAIAYVITRSGPGALADAVTGGG